MENNRFNQYSETAALKKVIIGRYQNYAENTDYIEIVNEDQKKGLPSQQLLQEEFEAFKTILRDKGVEVVVPDYVGPFVYDQLTPRDIGVTIGDRFLMCNMKRASRRYEVAGVFSTLNQMQGGSPAIIIPPENDMLLEGGDILVDKDKIFVGIAQRSNMSGFQFLNDEFCSDFEVIPVYCSSLGEGENVLHLDCTFNRIGNNHALIYPRGFKEIPEQMRDYNWIEVTPEEQALLGTNVLSIDENTIIARKHPQLSGLNSRIRSEGFEVIETPFDGATATGGSFRCCSLPLLRI